MLEKLNSYVEDPIGDYQCGFCKGLINNKSDFHNQTDNKEMLELEYNFTDFKYVYDGTIREKMLSALTEIWMLV